MTGAGLEQRKGKWVIDEAIQQLGATHKTDPRFPLAHLWLGRSYQEKGMYDAAISEYRQTDNAWPGWVVKAHPHPGPPFLDVPHPHP